MEIKILESEKGKLKVEISSVTMAEILRVYLNKNSDIDIAVWRREHPDKNPILLVEGKKPKKAVKKAVDAIIKDLDETASEFKEMK